MIPSSRSMLSRDRPLPLDTWNTSGLQENAFGNQFSTFDSPRELPRRRCGQAFEGVREQACLVLFRLDPATPCGKCSFKINGPCNQRLYMIVPFWIVLKNDWVQESTLLSQCRVCSSLGMFVMIHLHIVEPSRSVRGDCRPGGQEKPSERQWQWMYSAKGR